MVREKKYTPYLDKYAGKGVVPGGPRGRDKNKALDLGRIQSEKRIFFL